MAPAGLALGGAYYGAALELAGQSAAAASLWAPYFPYAQQNAAAPWWQESASVRQAHGVAAARPLRAAAFLRGVRAVW